jgi:hypothetical protein
VALLALTPSLMGCESCSFSFGGKRVRATANHPVGMRVELEGCTESGLCQKLDGKREQPGQTSYEDFYIVAESDGVRDCKTQAGKLTFRGEGCETQVVDIAALTHDELREGKAQDVEVDMKCDPTALPPEVGRDCDGDEVCGGSGYRCGPSAKVCIPETCTSDDDCQNPHQPLQCNVETGECVPVP